MAKEEYSPLMSEDGLEGEDNATHRFSLARSTGLRKWYLPTYRGLMAIVIVESLLLMLGAVLFLAKGSPGVCLKNSRVLYSPALDVVEPEVKVYYVGFPGDLSPYQKPSSPELDKAWDDLYQFGISWITKDEAALLPNKTSPIPDDNGNYIAELDVFHNLHCLNMVRKALDPVYYPDWNITANEESAKHVSHCVDWIRQSIMCHADTSVIVWQWEDWKNASIVKGDVAHTCRNFEKVRDWAKERSLLKPFDETVHSTDDIVIPILQADYLM